MILALELEGVLAPATSPAMGATVRLKASSVTPRDRTAPAELMRQRIDAANRAGLKLADLQRVAHALEPFDGARQFLERIRPLGNAIVISDTFYELSEPLIAKLGFPSLFAN